MSSTQRSSAGFLYIAIVFAILVEAFLVIIYDNSASGIGSLFGEFVGTAFLPMLIAFYGSRKSENKATAFAVAIGFTAVFLLVSNRSKVLEGIEVREARTALQGVADLAGIEKAAQENPSNRLLGLTTEAFRSGQRDRALNE